MGKSSTVDPKASKAAARVRRKLAKKSSPAAAGAASNSPRLPRAPASTAPRDRELRVLKTADARTETLVACWKKTHIEEKIAKQQNDLARSAVVKRFDELAIDIAHTKSSGSIARVPRNGEIDYKALAIAELGEDHVAAVSEIYRKPPSNPVTAPNAWAAEAGLAN